MNDEITKELVNRFLAWKLPSTVYPDCGKPPRDYDTGTNLLSAEEARQMFTHALDGFCVVAHPPVPVRAPQGVSAEEVGNDRQHFICVCPDCAASRLGTGALPAISHDERAHLERFQECCEDGAQYDVPPQMMKRLAEIGLVRRVTGSIYEITEFGRATVRAATPPSAAPAEPTKPIAWVLLRKDDDGLEPIMFYGGSEKPTEEFKDKFELRAVWLEKPQSFEASDSMPGWMHYHSRVGRLIVDENGHHLRDRQFSIADMQQGAAFVMPKGEYDLYAYPAGEQPVQFAASPPGEVQVDAARPASMSLETMIAVNALRNVLAAQPTAGNYELCYLDTPLSEVGAYVQKCVDVSGGDKFQLIKALRADGVQVDVAHYGNGPTSNVNGAWACAASPDNIRKVLDALDAAMAHQAGVSEGA
jgi:hypothetical protein